MIGRYDVVAPKLTNTLLVYSMPSRNEWGICFVAPNARISRGGSDGSLLTGPVTPLAIMAMMMTVMIDVNDVAAKIEKSLYERGSVTIHEMTANTAAMPTMQPCQPR